MQHNHQTISFLTLTASTPTPTPASLSLSFCRLLFSVCRLLFAVCCLVLTFLQMSTVLQAARRAINACEEPPFWTGSGLAMRCTMCVLCVYVSGHLSFMWRNALPNCVQIAHTDNSFSLRHIKVFGCCPGKLLRQHVLHFAAHVKATRPQIRTGPEIQQSNRHCVLI